MANTVINKNYYIIKVTVDNGKKVFYKIGEAVPKDRPDDLIKKYTKLRANTAELLCFESLPYKKDKRLSDKVIHKNLDSNILKKANEYEIQVKLNETDGKDEFFELVDNSVNVVDYIKSVVKNISAINYTANTIYDRTLEYPADKYHLVNSDILNKILYTADNTFTKAGQIIYQDIMNPILLIGQFDHDFVGSIAMYNKLYIWHDSEEQKHEYTFSKINDNIIYLDKLGDILNMNIKFDLIIANPPYGKVGANITKTIIDNIDYDEYVNLLPANDYYKRRDNGDLFKYVQDMKPINDGFEDASVTTHMCNIVKIPTSITLDEFERAQYIDSDLNKYFAENVKRNHPSIDAAYRPHFNTLRDDVNINNTIIIGIRDISAKHLPFSKNVDSYLWNVEKSINLNKLISNIGNTGSTNTQFSHYFITGLSSVERLNFVTFMYSDLGFKFISKLFKAVNVDSMIALGKVLPKVDWTRSWTVEEILADYGYTESEIKKVMDDLVNFKGMED